jgi:UDP-N-acetyl-D-galactosamine dehydrogenase
MTSHRRIAVLGLGYVGLPLALGLAKKFPEVRGFDVNEQKLQQYEQGVDATREGFEGELASTTLIFCHHSSELRNADFFIVGVPTPIDSYKRPDLKPLRSVCKMLSPLLKRGDIVCFESTVYPGVTEEVCGPILERESGLKSGKDFFLAYSPERINPGDKEHTLESIVKVVSGQTPEVLDIVASVYSAVVTAGVHRASSIKIAEAAKVIENTQRDLNIALMNELALIFDRLGIPTIEVLKAAGSKWNFLPFRPGLVGGHCIGVDPYYLTSKAEQLGYAPRVILAGRGINDSMGQEIAAKAVKLLIQGGHCVRGARIAVLGVTFKENVTDTRNSRVPDIIRELHEFGVETLTYDPIADAAEVHEEYGVTLCDASELQNLQGIILAVPHQALLAQGLDALTSGVVDSGIVVDVKSAFYGTELSRGICYWAL